jgi:crotonobetainyl-CoA:carnitine CoA-transferase CaiB-like acyl-CoA transferase
MTGQGQHIDMALLVRTADRVHHRGMLVPLLEPVMRSRCKHDWLAALEAAKVPSGAINDLAEVFADPQVQAREIAVAVPHPLSDSLRLVASPISCRPHRYNGAARRRCRASTPMEMLADLGFDDQARVALRRRGVV